MTSRTLAHIGYVVPSMERGLRQFLKEGARVLIPPTLDPLQRVACCLLRMDDAAEVELVAPIEGQDSPVRARLARGGGLDHLCYYVDDLQAALAEEREHGALVVCEPCHAITFDATVAFVHRRSGAVIELMERRRS